MTGDAYHVTAPAPGGAGAALAMRRAITWAGLEPTDIDLIVAHGTSTPLNDAAETAAIKTAFGEHAYRVAITAPKSMIGHGMGTAGVHSGIAAILRHPRPDRPADDQPHYARPRLRPRLRPQRGPPDEDRPRHRQRLRLRRHERRDGDPAPLRGVDENAQEGQQKGSAMTRAPIHVSAEEFASNVDSFLSRVLETGETVVVEADTGAQAEVRPVSTRQRVSVARRRTPGPADLAAFLSAAGSWSDVDDAEFLRKVYESRDLPPRPLPEL